MIRFLLAFCMLAGPGLLLAQNRVLTGTVVGPDNSPVVSATVSEKGTSDATTTNSEGVFSLQVPSRAVTLTISSVGFGTKEVNVNASETNIAINLDASNVSLSEVVVTALGITKETRKLGYAVTTVDGDLLDKAREPNVGNSLSGRVAGLKVSGTSSGPGGTVKLLLRGNPSMNSSGAPLIVINGIPMDNTQRGQAGQWGGADNGDGIGNLNPDDIETMTVLKGQTASALYGSRASNGVIMITTKSGKKGDFSVDYNMNYVVEKAIDFTDFQYEYGQGLDGAKPLTAAAAQQTSRMSWGAKLDGSQVIQFDGNNYPYSAVKNNIDNFYRAGPSLTNTVALSKGGDNGSFRVSFSTLDNKSILRNSGLRRNTINLNVLQHITPKLSANIVVNFIDQLTRNVPYLSDGPLNANNGIFLSTNIDERILAPGYDTTTGFETQFGDDAYVTNPYFVVNQLRNDVGRKRFINSATLRYDFTKGIYAQGRVGYDVENDRTFSVTPWGTAYTQDRKGSLNSLARSERYELNVDGLVGVSQNLTQDLGVDVALGANLRKNQFENVSVSGGPFILPYLYTPGNVVNIGRGYEFSKSEVHSAYYTVDFSYKKFLTLGTTGRYDAYSTLPEGNNTIFVPSVSASFIFSDLAQINGLNFGKLRASYAQTSNELTTPYQTSIYYSLGNAYLGTPVGSFSTSLPSGLLKPFTTSELEFGTDLRFFNSRLTIDAAYYTKKTKNEIMPASFSISTGYTSGYVPTGSVQNKGFELQLGGTPISMKNFSWVSTFNFTTVKNEVLSTGPNGAPLNLGQNRATLGNAVTAYVVGYAGPQILAYDYKYDSKGDIVVNSSGYPMRGELLPQGSVLPTVYGGWNNQFNVKGFNLSFLIDYNYGNKILSATSYYSLVRGLNKQTLEGRDGITTGVDESGNPNTVMASARGYYTALAQNVTKVHVVDGDFIKLRQVTLGYSLPSKVFQNIPLISSLDISLVGRNLWTIMKKSDNIDPEATFGSTVQYLGIEGTSLPTTRSYGINVNVKFKK